MQKYYKYQYRFNASHSMDSNPEHAHMHTFTVGLYIGREQEWIFNDIDSVVRDYLEPYEQAYLNDLPEFRGRVPNLENLGDVLFEGLERKLAEQGATVYQLDIGDNPLSVYQISTRLHLPMSVCKEVQEEETAEVLQQVAATTESGK